MKLFFVGKRFLNSVIFFLWQVSDSIMASARPGSSSGGGLLMSLPALGSGSHVRTGSGNSLHSNAPVDLSELGFVLSSGAGSDGPSRPSSTESSLSGAPSQVIYCISTDICLV